MDKFCGCLEAAEKKLKDDFSIIAKDELLKQVLAEMGEDSDVNFLVATYINRELGNLLGQDCILTESFGIVLNKARGIKDFLRQPGPARWAVDGINKGKFHNFKDAFRVIYEGRDYPGGGLISIMDKKTGRSFVLDPSIDFSPEEDGEHVCWDAKGDEYSVVLIEGFFSFTPKVFLAA